MTRILLNTRYLILIPVLGLALVAAFFCLREHWLDRTAF